jgi:hypothetical protein
MVAHPRLPIKTGRRMDQADAGPWRFSARQAEHQKECAVQLLGRFRVDATNHPPNAVAAQRDQLVCHDL